MRIFIARNVRISFSGAVIFELMLTNTLMAKQITVERITNFCAKTREHNALMMRLFNLKAHSKNKNVLSKHGVR